MNRAVRICRPVRVISETSTVPLTLDTSTCRPARRATISNRCATDPPTSTSTSTRSPFTTTSRFGTRGHVPVLTVGVEAGWGPAGRAAAGTAGADGSLGAQGHRSAGTGTRPPAPQRGAGRLPVGPAEAELDPIHVGDPPHGPSGMGVAAQAPVDRPDLGPGDVGLDGRLVDAAAPAAAGHGDRFGLSNGPEPCSGHSEPKRRHWTVTHSGWADGALSFSCRSNPVPRRLHRSV